MEGVPQPYGIKYSSVSYRYSACMYLDRFLTNPRPVKSTGAVPVEGLAVIFPGQSGH